MPIIHTAKNLPSEHSIQLVADYSKHFSSENFDYKMLLASLKNTLSTNNFMRNQDHYHWVVTCGVDYSNNPKLFAQAPLMYVCALISEIFKKYDIEEIHRRLPAPSLLQALLRLKSFCA